MSLPVKETKHRKVSGLALRGRNESVIGKSIARCSKVDSLPSQPPEMAHLNNGTIHYQKW